MKWENASFIATLLFMILAVFVSFVRSDFTTLMVVAIAYIYLVKREHNAVTYKMLLLATFGRVRVSINIVLDQTHKWQQPSNVF